VEQIDLMDREFQQLHASIELLVLNRKGSVTMHLLLMSLMSLPLKFKGW
jgi:hypothetical protein